MDKIKTLLFGMTGFGNSIAEALLCNQKTILSAILTNKRPEGSFPYYPCDHLYELALNAKVKCYEGLSLKEEASITLIKSLSPDLIIVSTYNQIIPASIIQIPKFGVINFHPSLLPRYRGTTPTVWVLLNGEKETGVTAHFIEDESIDNGRIICQTAIEVSPQETDGSLRFRLAELSKTTFQEALDLILSSQRDSFPLQDETKATYFPKRTGNDAEINEHWPFDQIQRRIRAMTPYPGAYIYRGKTKRIVQAAELLSDKETIQTERDFFDVRTEKGIIRFYSREACANDN